MTNKNDDLRHNFFKNLSTFQPAPPSAHKPTVSYDLQKMSELHRLMTRSYEEAQRAISMASHAETQARRSAQTIYASLIGLELEIDELQKKYGLKESQFRFITLENEEDEDSEQSKEDAKERSRTGFDGSCKGDDDDNGPEAA